MSKIMRINEFLLSKNNSIEIIINYIAGSLNIDLNHYGETWEVSRDGEKFYGELYISLKSPKAIRFNWSGDVRNIIGVDLWEDYAFDRNPDWFLDLKDFTFDNNFKIFSDFFKNPSGEVVYEMKGDAMGPTKPGKETAETKNTEAASNNADFDIDLFKTIEYYSYQVATGKSNSLMITGLSGLGKTKIVRCVIKALGMIEDVHYFYATGAATSSGLYEILYKNRDKLIIFDDCDSVFNDDDAINMLKGALDTYKIRTISKLATTKGGRFFDAAGLDDYDAEQRFLETGNLPNKFQFTGQIIFISNLFEDELDPALISRSLHVDIDLTKEEIINKIKIDLKDMCPEVKMSEKQETFNFLIEITDKFPTKFPLNFRTLIHCINLRVGNRGKFDIGGRQEDLWKLLVRKYLIRPVKKNDENVIS